MRWISGRGPTHQPICQPVAEKVLPAELMVMVRSHMPGNDAKVHVAAAKEGFFRGAFRRRGVHNVLVDFVRKDHAVGAGQFQGLGNHFHFVAGKDFARGIVRGIQYDGLGVGVDFLLECFSVQDPFTSRQDGFAIFTIITLHIAVGSKLEWHKDGRPTRQFDLIDVQVKKGFKENDFVPGLDQRLQRQVQRLTGPDRDGDLVQRVNLVPQVHRVAARQLLHQVRVPRGSGVLVGRRLCRRVESGLDQTVDGKFGWQPIRKTLPEIGQFAVVFLCDAGEFRPDRRVGGDTAEPCRGLARSGSGKVADGCGVVVLDDGSSSDTTS